MTKQSAILSVFMVLLPHALSSDLAHVQRSLADESSNNETSRISVANDSTTAATAPAIPDQDPIMVLANLTGSPKDSQEPMKVLATINTSNEVGKKPTVSLAPPSFPGAPVNLVANVPPHTPVEITADVLPDRPIKFQTEASPDVPLVAVVVGHGMARFYSPWKKASSATRNMFNVNLR